MVGQMSYLKLPARKILSAWHGSVPVPMPLSPLWRSLLTAQLLPLPEMYGKNLVFKTGGVDGCDCAEILRLIAAGQIDTTPLITHRFSLEEIDEAYRIFENRLEGVIKVAIVGR